MGTRMSRMAWINSAIVLTGLLTGCAGPGTSLISWWHGDNRTETLTAQAASVAPTATAGENNDTGTLTAQADEMYRDAKAQAEYQRQNPGSSGTCSSGSCSSASCSSGSRGCGGSCCSGS